MARISRRAVLAAAVALAAVPAGFVASRAAQPRAKVAAGHLRDALPGLAVSDAEINVFAETWTKRLDPENWRKRFLDAVFAVMANPELAPALAGRLRVGYEDTSRDLVSTFLLSTDFFNEAGERPERTRYVAYHDAYERGCRNPIARFEAEA